jgi:hypothetical protein
MKRGISYSPEPLEIAPTLSFLDMEGWACSNGLFNLEKGGIA